MKVHHAQRGHSQERKLKLSGGRSQERKQGRRLNHALARLPRRHLRRSRRTAGEGLQGDGGDQSAAAAMADGGAAAVQVAGYVTPWHSLNCRLRCRHCCSRDCRTASADRADEDGRETRLGGENIHQPRYRRHQPPDPLVLTQSAGIVGAA